jgi:glycosyltransferase involved in cell wall biosynthesis
VTGQAKRDLLARADLFCLPSDGEGFSMAVLEALASATPVLLSRGCHFPEAEAAGAGRVVDATPHDLAEALGPLLSDTARLAAMGQRGLALVTRDYSWKAVVSRLEEAYGEGRERCRA